MSPPSEIPFSASPLSQEDDLLAAEFVLGTLPLGERALAEARAKRDAGFARAVQDWEIRLSGLNGDFAPMPAPDLLPALEARLFPRAPRRWVDWRLWGGAFAAAAALVAYLAFAPLRPDYIATIAAEDGALAYEARLTGGRLEVARLEGAAPDATHDHELWLIVGAEPPVSLGLVSQGARLTLAEVPARAILAISLEPLGGSPTGQPTGPVLALGELRAS